MEENKNLISALYPFQDNLDLDDDQRHDWLVDNINGNYIGILQLKIELNAALADKCFEWVSFAQNMSLLVSATNYANHEIANFVKFVLMDFLYPEKKIIEDQIKELRTDVITILEGHVENDGWMDSYDLYNALIQHKKYHELEYYNLWKIDLYNQGMERKPIENKYQEIGFLR